MHRSSSLSQPRVLLILLTLFSLLAVSGCGFQPRGQTSAPSASLSPMLVTGLPSHHAFFRILTHQLEVSGVTLTTSQKDAASALKIHRQKTERRVLSVDSRSKTVEYAIEESVEFSVQQPAGTQLGDRRFLSANRILFNPGTQILGRAREETLLREDMHKQLGRLIIDQLAAIR